MNSPSQDKIFFLPGLNGIRAIGILGVIASHTIHALNKFGLDNTIIGITEDGRPRGIDFSHYAVTMFFVLSGFLITSLLTKEKEQYGMMSVRNFYIRRILRIWPLYYSYFVLVLLTIHIFHLNYNSNMIPFYIFLAANIPFFLSEAIPLLGHYWTLGVEEQFYLLFPSIARLNTNKLLRYTILLIVLFMLLKLIAWYLSANTHYKLPYRYLLLCRFQAMMAGVIAAIIFLQNHPIISLLSKRWLYLMSWLCVGLSMINQFHISSFIDHEIMIMATIIIIFEQIQSKPKCINLENRIMDFLGKISYSIYVTHILVIFLISKLAVYLIPYGLVNYYTVFTTVPIACIFVAYLSYNYFEMPFLNLKRKFEKISGNRP